MEEARAYALDVLVEVHDEGELRRAVALGGDVHRHQQPRSAHVRDRSRRQRTSAAAGSARHSSRSARAACATPPTSCACAPPGRTRIPDRRGADARRGSRSADPRAARRRGSGARTIAGVTWVKFCGCTSWATRELAVEAGADADRNDLRAFAAAQVGDRRRARDRRSARRARRGRRRSVVNPSPRRTRCARWSLSGAACPVLGRRERRNSCAARRPLRSRPFTWMRAADTRAARSGVRTVSAGARPLFDTLRRRTGRRHRRRRSRGSASPAIARRRRDRRDRRRLDPGERRCVRARARGRSGSTFAPASKATGARTRRRCARSFAPCGPPMRA